ncbi:hypothetical protein RchiOBHm_Chr4g0414511 [Rosa chinensis]|uniref:Uncharacterized protein n=1 Tax=Rosa chinensis TaxID=74649 RepID=A0A2P6QWE3_ROSCH|nr:hypothetical protein RchiOBHm_Chr4g0414511 [Rosa chinensis]
MELNQGILYNIYEAKKNHLKCGTKGQPLIIDFTVAHWSSLLYDSVVNFLSSSPLEDIRLLMDQRCFTTSLSQKETPK